MSIERTKRIRFRRLQRRKQQRDQKNTAQKKRLVKITRNQPAVKKS